MKNAHTKQDEFKPDSSSSNKDEQKRNDNIKDNDDEQNINIDLIKNNIDKLKKDKDGEIDVASLLKITDQKLKTSQKIFILTIILNMTSLIILSRELIKLILKAIIKKTALIKRLI